MRVIRGQEGGEGGKVALGVQGPFCCCCCCLLFSFLFLMLPYFF